MHLAQGASKVVLTFVVQVAIHSSSGSCLRSAPEVVQLTARLALSRRPALRHRDPDNGGLCINKARGVKLGRKPKLTPHQKGEALERRERGEETYAEIGRSYNESGWTISRLTADDRMAFPRNAATEPIVLANILAEPAHTMAVLRGEII
jgi:hypothetical protein